MWVYFDVKKCQILAIVSEREGEEGGREREEGGREGGREGGKEGRREGGRGRKRDRRRVRGGEWFTCSSAIILNATLTLLPINS